MPLPQKHLIPGILLMLMLAALASPPLWWSDGDPNSEDNKPVLTDAPPNHQGPANIGQAKHMADMALKALAIKDQNLSASIRQKLTTPQPNPYDLDGPPLREIIKFELPSPLPPDWSQSQRAPLLIGQLKAIAAPFYDALHTYDPTWLETQLVSNQTKDTQDTNNFYPWTTDASNDNNKAIATTGQLKAVFSLRFEMLTSADSDNDGLLDTWEIEHFANLSETGTGDFDEDGVNNLQEFINGTDPNTAKLPKIWGFRKANNSDGTVTYSWNSHAKIGDWFHIERLQPDRSWKVIYSTTYGSVDLPFVENATSYAITLNPLTDFLQ